MSSLRQISLAALTVIAAAAVFSPPSSAHGNHHGMHHGHHHHKKQKAYNKGYRKGYNKAVKGSYYAPYRVYRPYYAPVRRPVVVAPAPWVNPYHYGTRVNVGFGFNL
mgnify:FL=1